MASSKMVGASSSSSIHHEETYPPVGDSNDVAVDPLFDETLFNTSLRLLGLRVPVRQLTSVIPRLKKQFRLFPLVLQS